MSQQICLSEITSITANNSQIHQTQTKNHHTLIAG